MKVSRYPVVLWLYRTVIDSWVVVLVVVVLVVGIVVNKSGRDDVHIPIGSMYVKSNFGVLMWDVLYANRCLTDVCCSML